MMGLNLGKINQLATAQATPKKPELYVNTGTTSMDAMREKAMTRETVTITVTDNWCVIPRPTTVIKYLKERFSAFDSSARFQTLYKRGLWDGRYSVVSDEGVFGTGMLWEVIGILSAMGVPYVLDDKREFSLRNFPSPLFTDWKWTGKNLEDRPIQIEAVDAIFASTRGLLSLPTGVGKTQTFINFIFKAGLPTLIGVPKTDLLFQTAKVLEESIKGIKIGVLGGGVKYTDEAQVVVATYATLIKLKTSCSEEDWHDWVSGFEVLIADECHNVVSDGKASATYNMIMSIPAFIRIGVSATPFEKKNTLQSMYLQSAFGDVIYNKSVQDVTNAGYLVPCHTYILKPKYPMDLLEQTSYHRVDDLEEVRYNEEHDKFIVENDTRNTLIADATKGMLEEGHKIIVVAQRIPHNDTLYGLLQGCGYNVYQFHGKTPGRKKVLEVYTNDKTPCVLVASSIANEGIDVPDITCVIVAHGGKSFYQVMQRIGRGLRLAPGKENLAVIDFDDSALGIWFANHYEKRLKHYRNDIGATIEYLGAK